MRAFKFREKLAKQQQINSIQSTEKTQHSSNIKNINMTGKYSGMTQDFIQQTTSRIQFNKIREKAYMDDVYDQQSKSSSFSLESSQNFNTNSIIFRSQIIKNLPDFKKMLDLGKIQYSLKLIFRASQHNFDVDKFHRICKDISPTVTVAQISNGNIVGGYTPLIWNDKFQRDKTHYKTDSSAQSFLFNFTTKQKFSLTKQFHNKAIVGCKHLGPTFGGGYDLSIGNFANKKYSSSCDYPTSYRKQKQELNSKMSRKLFLGTSEELFLIKEWEIFQVCCSFDIQRPQDKKQLLIQTNVQKNISLPKVFEKIIRTFF